MHRIDGPGHVANQFTEGDPGAGQPPTRVTDDWLNAVQEEIAKLVEALGVPLNKADNGQLAAALIGTGWQNLSLAAGWQAPFIGQEPQFRVDGFKRVWMRGTVYRTGGAGAVPGPVVTELPANAKPPNGRQFSVAALVFDGAGSVLGRIVITAADGVPSGQLNVSRVVAGNVYSVDLDGVCYYTA